MVPAEFVRNSAVHFNTSRKDLLDLLLPELDIGVCRSPPKQKIFAGSFSSAPRGKRRLGYWRPPEVLVSSWDVLWDIEVMFYKHEAELWLISCLINGDAPVLCEVDPKFSLWHCQPKVRKWKQMWKALVWDPGLAATATTSVLRRKGR